MIYYWKKSWEPYSPYVFPMFEKNWKSVPKNLHNKT